jgi:hypothetical protein
MSITAPAKALSLHDQVIDASARTYELSGQVIWKREATAKWALGAEPFDLVVPSLRRVEEIETAETLDQLDLDRLAQCRQAGLEVWVLVPLNHVGAVHARLLGVVDRVQPWWLVDDRVVFGDPRRA